MVTGGALLMYRIKSRLSQDCSTVISSACGESVCIENARLTPDSVLIRERLLHDDKAARSKIAVLHSLSVGAKEKY